MLDPPRALRQGETVRAGSDMDNTCNKHTVGTQSGESGIDTKGVAGRGLNLLPATPINSGTWSGLVHISAIIPALTPDRAIMVSPSPIRRTTSL